jgi:hypothetical protein
MHRRLSPLTALAATAVAAGASWIAPTTAHAGKYDLDLTRLASQETGSLVQDDSGFRSLSSELGTLMAPRPVDTADSLGLTGTEMYSITGLSDSEHDEPVPTEVAVHVVDDIGETVEFTAKVRIETPKEADYYRHGGILQYVLRQLAR